MIKRTVANSAAIIGSDGLPIANLALIFKLVDSGYNPAGTFDIFTTERIMPLRHEVKTDLQGKFTIDLWPTSRGQDARLWLCEIRWPLSDREFFAAPLIDDAFPLDWFTWKSSSWKILSSEVSAFEIHVQDSSQHVSPTDRATIHDEALLASQKADEAVAAANRANSFRYAGIWAPGTYTPPDVVSYQGSIWKALRVTAIEPISGLDWDLVVQKGEPGPPGAGINLAPADRAAAGEYIFIRGVMNGNVYDAATQALIAAKIALGWPDWAIIVRVVVPGVALLAGQSVTTSTGTISGIGVAANAAPTSTVVFSSFS